jgi:hypothetical protein
MWPGRAFALGAWGHARPHESTLHFRWAFSWRLFVQLPPSVLSPGLPQGRGFPLSDPAHVIEREAEEDWGGKRKAPAPRRLLIDGTCGKVPRR